MNKIYIKILLTILFTNSVFTQTNYASINIFRPKKTLGGSSKNFIIINGENICEIKNGGQLEYNVSSSKTLSIQVFTTAFDSTTKSVSRLELDIEEGRTYYLIINTNSSKIEIIQSNSPPNKEKIKTKYFLSHSDSEFESNSILSKHKNTGWTKESLKEHWINSENTSIEGIYENVGDGYQFEIAVIKENENYNIIYLTGFEGSHWNEGDLKAKLIKTASFGIFKSEWHMFNKRINKDMIVTFEDSFIKTNSPIQQSNSLFLKIYPKYDDDDSGLKSNWKGSGSGFFISTDGYIITNYHVVKNKKTIKIEFLRNGEREEYNVKIIQSDEVNDLSILKIENPDFLNLNTVPYSFNSKVSDVGSNVFTLGYPMALGVMGKEIKFTDGKISSKTGYKGTISTYQISTPIQSGNSGGPLFDYDGKLIGITSSGLRKDITENVNYAIKLSYLQALIDVLPNKIDIPNDDTISQFTLTEKIKILSNCVVLIKVK